MKVLTAADIYNLPEHTITTLGTFDGMHAGHRRLLCSMVKEGKAKSLKTLVITFDRHPRLVLKSAAGIKLIQSLEERIKEIKNLGIDYLYILNFTLELANMEAEDFISKFLIQKFNTKEIFLSEDTGFGKGRRGNIELIRQLSDDNKIDLHVLPIITMENAKVSSTRIRDALSSGDIELANKLLGKPFAIKRRVIHGLKLGTELSFPTANLEVIPELIVPKDGVYAVHIYIFGEKYNGIMNIGSCPTIDRHPYSLEVFIFNFTSNIYGKAIKVEFVQRIRNEKKFDNFEELKKQITADREMAENVLI